jgi:hypothetical protein
MQSEPAVTTAASYRSAFADYVPQHATRAVVAATFKANAARAG